MRKWQSKIKKGLLLRINETPVTSKQDIIGIVAKAIQEQYSELQLTFATEEKMSMYPEHGTPQLFFDQINTIAAYLQDIKYDEDFIDLETNTLLVYHLQKRKKKERTIHKQRIKSSRRLGRLEIK